MAELLTNPFADEPQFLFATIAVLLVFGLPALTIFAVAAMTTWRKHRATKFAHDLKAEMIAAGMSADEIERVLSAKMSER
jgi:hypothetical protein